MKKSIAIIVLLVSFSMLWADVSRKRYLDPKFAFKKNRISSPDEGEQKKLKSVFSALKAEGLSLYGAKRDAEAVQKYEQAMEIHTDGEIYYLYGNSLSNIGELENAVSSYDISNSLIFANPELSWFNMACAQSRMGKNSEAVNSLRKAIIYGYPSIENISKDPDLSGIRKERGWTGTLSELKKIFERGNTPLVSGKTAVLEVASTSDAYCFCPDGTAVLRKSISEIKNHRLYGKWSFRNYIVSIEWRVEEGEKGIGRPAGCGATCFYDKYKPFSKKISSKETLRWGEIEENREELWHVQDSGPCCKK
ncbi:MAG: tetratricopeptide repeat protein [Spirochaetes bacterium]|jgi:tetratricopeptide (TPR) repeat protein|nr:tetratricopeptide repeat protein [Spirochaetota bacterium]